MPLTEALPPTAGHLLPFLERKLLPKWNVPFSTFQPQSPFPPAINRILNIYGN